MTKSQLPEIATTAAELRAVATALIGSEIVQRLEVKTRQDVGWTEELAFPGGHEVAVWVNGDAEPFVTGRTMHHALLRLLDPKLRQRLQARTERRRVALLHLVEQYRSAAHVSEEEDKDVEAHDMPPSS